MGKTDNDGSNTNQITFGNGGIGGAETHLYVGDNGNVTVHYAPTLSIPVGNLAGSFDHANFNSTDIDLIGANGNVIGFFGGRSCAE